MPSEMTEPPKYPIRNIMDVHIANKIMTIEAGVVYANSNFDNCEIRVPIDSDTPRFFYCHFENCDFVPPLQVDMTNEYAGEITDHRMKGCGVYEQTHRPVYSPRIAQNGSMNRMPADFNATQPIVVRKQFSCSGPGWEVNTYFRWGTFFAERHQGQCPCSYCTKARWPIAIWLPQIKTWNAWRVVAIRLMRSRWYVRWTLAQRNTP